MTSHFFFPLALGIAKGQRASRKDAPVQRDYDEWREGIDRSEAYDEVPEAEVLNRLLAQPAKSLSRRPVLILGEPGAGKSALLAEWHRRCLSRLSAPRLGLPVPVLVRLGEIGWDGSPPPIDHVADDLWRVHGARAALAASRGIPGEANVEQVFDLPPRLFTPVWLLDGLDELATGDLASAELWETLTTLPGAVVLSCRLAAFERVQRHVARWIGQEYRISGLKPREQAAFLNQALRSEGLDANRAPELMRQINDNSALRPLAASPFILSLIAEAFARLTFPANRAAFYKEAILALWDRKLGGEKELFGLFDVSLRLLANLAVTMNFRVNAPQSLLSKLGATPVIQDALRRSGLLRFDDARQQLAFPHLTFQEYHHARALLSRPFADVLAEHWVDFHHEEVLALLVALHASNGQTQLINAVLRKFVDKAFDIHVTHPDKFWLLRRSPLRVVLHLISRAATPGVVMPISLADEPALLRVAIANDRRSPPEALAVLARDTEAIGVAYNPAAPPAALAAFVRHKDPKYRAAAAKNPATPVELLNALVHDDDAAVRAAVARNPAISAEHLTKFARDDEAEVRGAVAQNPGIPEAAFAVLARDENAEVRAHAAMNIAMLGAALEKLVSDANPQVRSCVAQNAATPAAVLAALARDEDIEVRGRVAWNPRTPPAALAVLSHDPVDWVRSKVAANVAISQELLAAFSRDESVLIRAGVAANPAAPSEILASLARDLDGGIFILKRYGNKALGGVSRAEVRLALASNIATPPEVLAALSFTPNHVILDLIALNSSTPPEVLAALFHVLDLEDGSRLTLAANPAILLEDLRRPRLSIAVLDRLLGSRLESGFSSYCGKRSEALIQRYKQLLPVRQ
jgi:hypothetical protein